MHFQLPFSPQTYSNRRSKIANQFADKPVLLFGSEPVARNFKDNQYPFRQNSTFLYYGGWNLPNLAIVLYPDGKEVLYGTEMTTDDAIWAIMEPSLAALGKKIGISNTRKWSKLTTDLSNGEFHFFPPTQASQTISYQKLFGLSLEQIRQSKSSELVQFTIDQRLIKSGEEVAEIERALDITNQLHLLFLHNCKTGATEKSIVGKIHDYLIANDAELAYQCILSERGEVLHNHSYQNTLKANSLVVGDIGAETAAGYASDITRTYPSDRKFVGAQRDFYQLVLDSQKQAIEAMRPGKAFLSVHMLAAKVLTEGLIDMGIFKGDAAEMVNAGAHALLFPHGLGHAMGLDVHDLEEFGEDKVGYDDTIKRSDIFGLKNLRFGREMQANMVMTVEPGLYFIPSLIEKWKKEQKFSQWINYEALSKLYDFGGIRIEDDILVTETGYKILGPSIPKEISEIEQVL